MRQFQIHGPFPIKCSTPRHVHPDDAAAFWAKPAVAKWKGKKGVYVLAVRNRGMTPWYIGSTTKRTFEKEALGAHQLVAFNSALQYVKKGTPLVFLIAAQGRGASSTAIDSLETELILTGRYVNPNLKNQRKRKDPRRWEIRGVGLVLDVYPTGRGTAKAGGVQEFCKMMSAFT